MRLYQILNETTLNDSNCPKDLKDYIEEIIKEMIGTGDVKSGKLSVDMHLNPEALNRVIELWNYYKNSDTFDWYGFLWWFVWANVKNDWNPKNYRFHDSWPEIKEFFELSPTKWEKSKSQSKDLSDLGDILANMAAAPDQRRALAKAMGNSNNRYAPVVADLTKYLNQVAEKNVLKDIIDDIKINNIVDAVSWIRDLTDDMESAKRKNDNETYLVTKEIIELVDSVLRKHNLLHNFYGYEGYNKIKGSQDD